MRYRIEASLGFAIQRLDMRMTQIGAQLLRPHGLTPEQFVVLATLFNHDGMSQRELADYLSKDRPNITRILDKLQEKGLVVRRPDSEDRRIYRVGATAEGYELIECLTPMVLEARKRFFSTLSADEQATMREMLDRLYRSLE